MGVNMDNKTRGGREVEETGGGRESRSNRFEDVGDMSRVGRGQAQINQLYKQARIRGTLPLWMGLTRSGASACG